MAEVLEELRPWQSRLGPLPPGEEGPEGAPRKIAGALGTTVRDVVITREEIRGLMAGLLCVDSPPTGRTRLTDWAVEHAESLGRRYASELARRRDRVSEYAEGLPRERTLRRPAQ